MTIRACLGRRVHVSSGVRCVNLSRPQLYKHVTKDSKLFMQPVAAYAIESHTAEAESIRKGRVLGRQNAWLQSQKLEKGVGEISMPTHQSRDSGPSNDGEIVDPKSKSKEGVNPRPKNGTRTTRNTDSSNSKISSLRTWSSSPIPSLTSTQIYRGLFTWSRAEHFLRWINGLPRQHFGPAARVPDLFERRDLLYFHLEDRALGWKFKAPPVHHDIFDVTERVNKVEKIIGYKFKNKMLCVEALKVSGMGTPIGFEGIAFPVGQNKRLALLGDRTLSMSLCETWFHTGNNNAQYATMQSHLASRQTLYARGKASGLDETCMLHQDSCRDPNSTKMKNAIAETFEAVLGAVFLDSGSQFVQVKDLIKRMGLDQHYFLNTMSEQQAKEAKEKADEQEAAKETALKPEVVKAARPKVGPQAKEAKEKADKERAFGMRAEKIDRETPTEEETAQKDKVSKTPELSFRVPRVQFPMMESQPEGKAEKAEIEAAREVAEKHMHKDTVKSLAERNKQEREEVEVKVNRKEAESSEVSAKTCKSPALLGDSLFRSTRRQADATLEQERVAEAKAHLLPSENKPKVETKIKTTKRIKPANGNVRDYSQVTEVVEETSTTDKAAKSREGVDVSIRPSTTQRIKHRTTGNTGKNQRVLGEIKRVSQKIRLRQKLWNVRADAITNAMSDGTTAASKSVPIREEDPDNEAGPFEISLGNESKSSNDMGPSKGATSAVGDVETDNPTSARKMETVTERNSTKEDPTMDFLFADFRDISLQDSQIAVSSSSIAEISDGAKSDSIVGDAVRNEEDHFTTNTSSSNKNVSASISTPNLSPAAFAVEERAEEFQRRLKANLLDNQKSNSGLSGLQGFEINGQAVKLAEMKAEAAEAYISTIASTRRATIYNTNGFVDMDVGALRKMIQAKARNMKREDRSQIKVMHDVLMAKLREQGKGAKIEVN